MPAADASPQVVNFDAIGKYFCAKGGKALVPSKHFTSLNLCAFIQCNPGDEFHRHPQGISGSISGIRPRRPVCHDELVECLP